MRLKICNIIFLILAIASAIIETFFLVNNYSRDGLFYYILGILCMLFSIFGLVIPKKTYTIIWRLLSGLMSDDYDYDLGVYRMPKCVFGTSIASICFQIFALLLTIL